ncbi:peptidase E [Sphingomonas bacterium]|uniref:Type 1 glutamine amidotransferase-like domain-containing protein n=1 Tax=Sphingomonas bacterium TaxID=1895847 RepID=UPI0015773379|nr:peptidase E [Sphingomonas bacterium]
MKRREFLVSSLAGVTALGVSAGAQAASQADPRPDPAAPAKGKILIAGGRYDTKWIGYMAKLTGKRRPKLLFIAPASFDRPEGVVRWFENCAPLDVEASFQPSAIATATEKRGWDEILLSVDGIVVSGGNTLNQQAIWKAHGIDAILRQAWERGIVLGGASAGSLAWFEEGTTDSRAKELSTVQCLGFIKGSHSPHYDGEKNRRPFYQNAVATGLLKPGYACDNNAGIYFEGGTAKRFLSAQPGSNVYRVSASGGQVVETIVPTESF